MKNLKCSVYIENLPSRKEFYIILERFLKDNHLSEDYKLTNNTGGIDVKFGNPDNAYKFLKYLNEYRLEHPNYNKMKAVLNLDAKTRFMSPKNNKYKEIDSDNYYIDKEKFNVRFDFLN